METAYNRPSLPPSSRQRRRGIVRLSLTLLVVVAVPVVLAFLFTEEASVRFNGVVDSGAENVAPVEPSRIVAIDVVQGQAVKAGDVLVRFDSAQRLLENSLSEIKIRDLEQQLARRRDELVETERHCRELERAAAQRLEECRMNRTRDEATLAGYEAELELMIPLVEKRLASELDVMKVRPQVVSLKRIVAGYKDLESVLVASLETAREDLASAARRRASGEADAARAAEDIRAAARRSEDLRQINPTVLRALSDGVVTRVFHRPGDIVTDGEPVLRLNSADEGLYVTGMLPPGMQDAVSVGDRVYVTRQVYKTGSNMKSMPAEVVAVDAEVMDLFDNSGKLSDTTVRGRKVHIKVLSGQEGFVPGESVTITDRPVDFISNLRDRNN